MTEILKHMKVRASFTVISFNGYVVCLYLYSQSTGLVRRGMLYENVNVLCDMGLAWQECTRRFFRDLILW